MRKLVSRSVWKTWGIALLGGTIGGGLLAAGWAAEVLAIPVGPGFYRFFNLAEGRIISAYVTALILISSQMAGLIGWMRSQSLQDFRGLYRGWAFCAMAGLGAAIIMQTELKAAWIETIAWFWPVAFANRDFLCAAIPVVLIASAMFRFMNREMRDCTGSRALLWLSTVAGVGLGLFSLTQFQLEPLTVRMLELGLSMLASLLLFVSLFLHTRHVMYCTVEPPQERPGVLSRAMKFALRSSLTSSKSSESTPRQSAGSASSRRSAIARKRAAAAKRKSAVSKSDPEGEASTAAPAKVALPKSAVPNSSGSRPSSVESQSVHSTPRVEEQFSSLSKRERKLLRKQGGVDSQPLRRSA